MGKIFITLILLMTCLGLLSNVHAETLENKTNEQKADEIKLLEQKFEKVATNGGKVVAAEISAELAKYGDLAVPVFERMILEESFEAFFFSVQGLKNINTVQSINVLENTYNILANKSAYSVRVKDVIVALGEMDNDSTSSFLKAVLHEGTDHAKIYAAQALYKRERNPEAEEILLSLAPKYIDALGIIVKSVTFIADRKEDVYKLAENILKTSKDRIMITHSIGILVRIGDQQSMGLLSKLFKEDRSETLSLAIVIGLGQSSSSIAKQTLAELEKVPGKSSFIKNKVREELSKNR